MIELKDYAKNHIEWLQGTYIQQSLQINGRNCWFQVDGRGAIWFEKGGQWIAGLKSGRTLGTKSGYLVDHESNKVVCPNNAKHWGASTYYVTSILAIFDPPPSPLSSCVIISKTPP